MATVVLPRSLVALFPGAERRCVVPGATVAEVIAGAGGLRPRAWPTGSCRPDRRSAST